MRRSCEFLRLSNILGIGRLFAAAAVQGRLYHLVRETRPGDGGDGAFLFGVHRRAEGGERISDLFSRSLESHKEQAPAFHPRFLGLRFWPHLSLDEEMQRRICFYRCLRFVTQRLIPKLRQLSGPQPPAVDRTCDVGRFTMSEHSLDGLARLDFPPEDLVEEVLGGDVLILGQNVYSLSWIPWSECPMSCHVQIQGEKYAVETGRKRHILMALERRFQDRMNPFSGGRRASRLELVSEMEANLCRLFALARKSEVLYRDPERSVVWRQDGSLFCCQEVPPFVMEGADRRLRLLARVRVGVRLDSLAPREVLGTNGAHVMENYDHAFVFNYSDLGDLCMGHDHRFFQRFWDMPLEDGIVEFLNAARLVLCAGCYHTPGATPYVPSGIEHHPLIDPGEVAARNLPVYRYYRTEVA